MVTGVWAVKAEVGLGAGGAPVSCYSPAGNRFEPGRRTLWPAKLRLVSRMNPVHWLIDTVIELYIWIVIASVVLSWLIAFNVINTRNAFVYQIADFLNRATEPALRPIRSILPNLGGIDISPVVLILLLVFIRRLLWQLFN
jgi:YggT family protein